LPQLEDLDLSGTKIDEFILLDLAEMKQLKRVWLAALELPPEAIEILRQALPKCNVQLN
jgi:hypothetical protein